MDEKIFKKKKIIVELGSEMDIKKIIDDKKIMLNVIKYPWINKK